MCKSETVIYMGYPGRRRGMYLGCPGRGRGNVSGLSWWGEGECIWVEGGVGLVGEGGQSPVIVTATYLPVSRAFRVRATRPPRASLSRRVRWSPPPCDCPWKSARRAVGCRPSGGGRDWVRRRFRRNNRGPFDCRTTSRQRQ